MKTLPVHSKKTKKQKNNNNKTTTKRKHYYCGTGSKHFSSNIPEALFLLDSRGFNYVWRGYDDKWSQHLRN